MTDRTGADPYVWEEEDGWWFGSTYTFDEVRGINDGGDERRGPFLTKEDALIAARADEAATPTWDGKL